MWGSPVDDSTDQPKEEKNPPCPRCDGDRVNRIGHDRIKTGKWIRPFVDPAALPLSPQRGYIYLCEKCGHSWKPTDSR
jgi:ribosomal protein L37AE/L43A